MHPDKNGAPGADEAFKSKLKETCVKTWPALVFTVSIDFFYRLLWTREMVWLDKEDVIETRHLTRPFFSLAHFCCPLPLPNNSCIKGLYSFE